MKSECITGKPCKKHDNKVHGREAEELRDGLEELIKGRERIKAEEIELLLARVDARDTLAFLENLPDKKPVKKGKATLDQCCPLMKLALDRYAGTKNGIMYSYSLGAEGPHEYITMQFPRLKSKKLYAFASPEERLRGANFAVFNYCPFCGHKRETT